MKSLKILQICSKPPYPANDGGALAMHMLTEGLSQCGHQVKVISLNTPKHPFLDKEIEQEYFDKHQPESVFIDSLATPIGAALSLFKRESYHLSRFYSEEFNKLVKSTLKQDKFDIVLLESLFSTPYINSIRENSSSKLVYRAHNIEFELWEKRYSELSNPLKKVLLKNMLSKLKKYEIETCKSVDAIVSITENDLKSFRSITNCTPLINIPFGVPITKNNNSIDSKQLFFIGALDWAPNIEGLKWFINKVWPLLYLYDKTIKFTIAGRNAIDWFATIQTPGIEFIGEVKDAKELMLSQGILINPLFSGGGMRIKVIEALACQKPIVSTSLGVDGINVHHKKEVMIGDSPEEFAKNTIELLENKNLLNIIAAQGQQYVEMEYDPAKLSQRLSTFLNTLIK